MGEAREGGDTSIGGPNVRFRETLWSAVLAARDGEGEAARDALGRLLSAYWKPVYFFIRRRGARVEDAKDLAQGFFAAMLEREFLKGVDPSRGKFRTFLLACLERWLAGERERAQAKKRGGGKTIVSLDAASAERELLADSGSSPERAFERAYDATVLAEAFARLRGRPHFDVLELHLSSGLGVSEIAKRTKRKPKDVENALYRARKRFREAVLEELRPSVASREEAEEELQAILARLGT